MVIPAMPHLRRLPDATSMLLRRHRVVLTVVLLLTSVLILNEVRRQRSFDAATYYFNGASNIHTEPLFPPLPYGCPTVEEQESLDATTACAGFPTDLLSSVQVVVKTGAGLKRRTQNMLDTMASCIPNVLIVSDAQDIVNGHQVLDILSELPPSYAVDNPDWAAYLGMQEKVDAGEAIEASHDGWKLDRFKFLPMMEKAFEQSPHAQWYVFIEPDVYIFWDTLFRLLGTMDPDQYHYVGSSSTGSHGVWFVYGGGGIVMSGKLVRDLLKQGRQKPSVKYEQMVKDDCCGDAVLAYVIYKELGHRMRSLYPTFSGQEPTQLRITKQKWCTPLLSLHRVTADMMSKIWRWERCRPPTDQPITYATFLDFFYTLQGGDGPSSSWDAGFEGTYKMPEDDAGHSSAQACEQACAANSTCLQYRYSGAQGRCRISHGIRMGRPVSDEQSEVISGWSELRLQELGFDPWKNPGNFCDSPAWLRPIKPRPTS